MQVERLNIEDDDQRREWDRFILGHSGGSFYHQCSWGLITKRVLGLEPVYLLVREQGEIRGVLPLVFLKSILFGRILCSLPFLNFGGPIADHVQALNALLETSKEYSRTLQVDYMELRSPTPVDANLPVSTHKVSMTVELSGNPDSVWSGFASKHRTAIRRAYKAGLSVQSGGLELLPRFYEVMQRSWRDLGTPLYSPRFFRAVSEAFGQDVRIFIANFDSNPVAVALNGYYSGVVEGMWAGQTPLGHSSNANYVLYWEMIKDASERGFLRYHLGRSTAGSGADQFKRKWNAVPQQLYWYHYRPSARRQDVLNTDNPRFQLAIYAWKRLPLWTARSIGPYLARLIP